MSIEVRGLSYSYSDGTPSVSELSFRARHGEVTAVVGPNGVGKTTLLQLIAGDLQPDEGHVVVNGDVAYLRQNPGFDDRDGSDDRSVPTVADALGLGLPTALRETYNAVAELTQRATAGDADAGMALAEALERWGSLGGYDVEATFDQITRATLRQSLVDARERPLTQLSGGERKRLIIASFLASPVDVLLLDEPDNFLDLHGKAWLDAELRATSKTILMVSHDRTLLSTAVDRILVIERNDAWVHGGTYATLPAARQERNEKLARDLTRWKAEERRLFQFYKLMKQRASISPDLASRADAAETRWRRFHDAGPPTPPPPEKEIVTRFTGSRSGSIAMRATALEQPGLFFPFDLTVWNEDRVLLLGENGVGKSTLLRSLRDFAASRAEELDRAPVRFGPTARVGFFSQDNALPGVVDETVPLLQIVAGRYGNDEAARKVLGRYGLANHVRHSLRELSGGQRARVQLIMLESERPNVLLLDEPTDNLDLESITSIEGALSELEATLIAISHDRSFARLFDRFVLFDRDGMVAETDDRELALDVAARPDFSVLDRKGLTLLTCPD